MPEITPEFLQRAGAYFAGHRAGGAFAGLIKDPTDTRIRTNVDQATRMNDDEGVELLGALKELEMARRSDILSIALEDVSDNSHRICVWWPDWMEIF